MFESHRHVSVLTRPTATLIFVLFVASAETSSVHSVRRSMEILQMHMNDVDNSTGAVVNVSQAHSADRRNMPWANMIFDSWGPGLPQTWENPMVCSSWDVSIDGSLLQDIDSNINFIEKATGNVVLHLSIRRNHGFVVFNSFTNIEWQVEERKAIPQPLDGSFHISPADENGWLVQFSHRSGGGSWEHLFRHRHSSFASGPGELGYEIETSFDPNSPAFTQTCLKTERRFPGIPLNDLSEVNDDDFYMLCPADNKFNGHCLHVGGNSWDVRLWGHPSELERVTSRSGTFARSSWKITRTHDGETVRFELGARGWEGCWLYWNLLHWEVWAGSHTEEEMWEYYPQDVSDATNGLAAWKFRLGVNERHTPKGWHAEWPREKDWILAEHADIRLENAPGTVFNIFKVTPPAPTGAQPADFARNKFFRICSSQNLCLVNYHGAVHGWGNPGAEEDIRAYQESIWHVYREGWGEHVVIESAVTPGQLLHVDDRENAHVSVHPTAPNEGSRWLLRQTSAANGRGWYEIMPSQRHTDKNLASDHLPHYPHLQQATSADGSGGGLLWYIEELREAA